MMPILKPEKVNGRMIARPHIRGGDGIMTRLDSPIVFHPPTIKIKHKIMSFEEMAGKLADHIVAQKAMKKTDLATLLCNFARAVAQNEALKNDQRTPG